MFSKLKKIYQTTIKSKLIFLAIIFISLLYFTNDFTLIDIEKTAIISAVGIDRVDNQYEVSCQILLPNDTSTKPEASQTVISGKGKTVASAIGNVHTRAGLYPKLTFCRLIILGMDTIKDDIVKPLNYFFRTEQFNDSAMLLASKESAKKVLESSSAIENVSSFAIQKIIEHSNTKISDVISINLYEFMRQYYSKSDSILLPCVTLAEEPEANSKPESQQETTNKTIFDINSALIIKNEKPVDEIDRRLVKAYNLITQKSERTYYSVDNLLQNDGLELLIDQKKVKISQSITSDIVLCQVDVAIKAMFVDRYNQEKNIEELTNNIKLTDETKRLLEKSITADLNALLQTMQINQADILNINNNLYKFKTKQYQGLLNSNKNIIAETKFEISVKVDSL